MGPESAPPVAEMRLQREGSGATVSDSEPHGQEA